MSEKIPQARARRVRYTFSAKLFLSAIVLGFGASAYALASLILGGVNV